MFEVCDTVDITLKTCRHLGGRKLYYLYLVFHFLCPFPSPPPLWDSAVRSPPLFIPLLGPQEDKSLPSLPTAKPCD